MEDYKKLLSEFVSLYEKPKVLIKYTDSVQYKNFSINNLTSGVIEDQDYSIIGQVEIIVNGYPDSLEYYENLSISKQNIINALWQLKVKLPKTAFQSEVGFVLGILFNCKANFDSEKMNESYTYLPLDSPKKLTLTELIFNRKEEIVYIDKERKWYATYEDNSRRQISVYYYFMIEILLELISFLENIHTIKREKSLQYFMLSYPNQSLTDFRLSLINKKMIEEIDIKSFNNVFLGRPVTQKINWIGDKEALKYFIMELIKGEFVDSVEAKWKTTANSFLIKGIEIDSTNISTQQRASEHSQNVIQKILANLQKKKPVKV